MHTLQTNGNLLSVATKIVSQISLSNRATPIEPAEVCLARIARQI